MGDNGLFEPRRPALALSEGGKRMAQIVLGRGPLERHALAGPFLQRLAIASDGLVKLRRSGLALPQSPKRIAEIVLGRGPVERPPCARTHRQAITIAVDGP